MLNQGDSNKKVNQSWTWTWLYIFYQWSTDHKMVDHTIFGEKLLSRENTNWSEHFWSEAPVNTLGAF